MIILLTGTPGAGKTLTAITLIRELSLAENRAVYYNHIDELSPALGWSELTDTAARKWFELPHGAIILIDECHHLFPTRPVGSIRPETIAKFTEHRHFGHDIYLISQHPHLIDSDLRKLVGKHIHLDRPLGKGMSTRYEWTKIQNDPNNYHSKKEALVSTHRDNKEIYDLYKSAEIHTIKYNIPWAKLIPAGALIAAFCIALYFFLGNITSITNRSLKSSGLGKDIPPETKQILAGNKSPIGTDKMTFEELNTPRVPRLAWTAPKYDKLNEPVTRPYPNACIRTANYCRCYTTQATRLYVSDDYCIRLLEAGGIFDDTKTSIYGENLKDVKPDAREDNSLSLEPHRKQPAGASLSIPTDSQLAP